MRFQLFLTLALISQARLLFPGKHTGFSSTDQTNPIAFFEGLFSALSIDSTPLTMEGCVLELDRISLELSKIALSIEHPDFKTLFTVLRQLERMIQDLPNAIRVCAEELKTDFEKLGLALQNIKFPKSIEYHEDFALIINGVDVFHDIQAIQMNLMMKMWYQAGYTMGGLLNRLALE